MGKEELEKIIEFCKSVELKGLDPFLIEVDDLIAVIKEYFPRWTDPDELSLDAKALNQVASVIKLQSEWIKHRSSSLYRDPFLIEEKIRTFPIAQITEIFLEDILEEDDEDDESGLFDEDTTDRFFIDDIYYLLDEDSVVMEFKGMVGAWDAKNNGEMTFSSAVLP